MQNNTIDFFISCGYPKALKMIQEIVKVRNDVQIRRMSIDDFWGGGELYLNGTWSAYKHFLDISRDTEDPESWISVEHFEDYA